MMGKLRSKTAQLPRGLILWASLSVLLAIGFLSTLADLGGLSVRESQRANDAHQRVIIDPVSGLISGMSGAHEDSSRDFDVGEEPTVTPKEAVKEAPTAEDPDEAEVTNAAQPVEAPEEKAKEEAAAPETTIEAVQEEQEEAKAEPRAQPAPQLKGLPALRTAPVQAAPVKAGDATPLVGAPAPEITEKKGDLLLPKTAGEKESKTSAATLYAKHFARTEDMTLLSIVIIDAGFNTESLNYLLALPPEVTVAISPYGGRAAEQIKALRAAGHETWAMLPVEGARYPQDDPGPLGIVNQLDAREAKKRLHQAMSATIGAVGFVLPPDETVSKLNKPWNEVLKEIKERGLLVLSTHSARSIDQVAQDKDMRSIVRRADLVLDSTPGAAFIRSKLSRLNEEAKAEGEFVVIATARPQTLKIISEWLKDKGVAEGITLAPLSGIYQPKTPSAPPPAPKKESAGGH